MKATKAWIAVVFGTRTAWMTVLAIVLVSAAVCGAAQEKEAAPAQQPTHDNSYVIGPEDVLAINVWKEQDLTRSITVRSDGKIALPLVGELQAAGQTSAQLEHEIAEKLHNFITDPEVTVMVEQVNSKKFNILGQVVRPGSYPLAQAGTIVDAIALAGGFKDFAKQKDIYVLRQTAGGGQQRIPFNYKDFVRGKGQAQNIMLTPHDTIIVP